jgi:hypothetical protein
MWISLVAAQVSTPAPSKTVRQAHDLRRKRRGNMLLAILPSDVFADAHMSDKAHGQLPDRLVENSIFR